ncbi:type I iterative polyketide synthase [Penicillium angulare]|uniref:Type I iterative polyketide synthase n=1 Tax=Penicillium angulare TaxID=116970 RepID=A0A9W9ETB0_9EURO|nr:type I iterative polyketide synthase [Penicillium angulare]
MSASRNKPIAIVGMGCRFPGEASSPSKLWDLLHNPRDVVRDIPDSRFNLDRFYHPTGSHHGTTNIRQAYLLAEDVHEFDAKFFSIPPGEAEAIDPQQRILLEVVYEALESSGHTLADLSNSNTGAFVGLMSQDYFALNGHDVNSVPTYAASGTAASNASSRLSYFFNWHGPSMTIDTACSSSLVAVNEAVQTLRNGTSRVAVACGTNLCLSAFTFITLSKLGMLSPSSRCHMWDIDADGYARGEGAACVVLKTLSDAIADGDHIEAVIREVGVNHDGRTKGLTMPSATAQAELIRETYARAGLDPTKETDRCQYFEAHGTGTKAGDPQEAEALMRAFFPDASSQGELFVGSIKTVVGHTEGTAGLAGLMKACLALKNETIPANLLFNKLNPDLEPFTAHLRIPTANQPWPKLADNKPRRASVNSFGFGGANAHCILETYDQASSVELAPEAEKVSLESCCIPFVYSAASESSLMEVLRSSLEFINNDDYVNPSQLAHNLSTKRSALQRRIAISASSIDQLREKIVSLIESASEKSSSPLSTSAIPGDVSLLGVFTGQGAQWQGMGAQLISSIPLARRTMKQLDLSLASLPSDHQPSWSLIEILSDSTAPIGEAALSQPLCTAVQIILVDLLSAAGVKFQAVIGHSSGEIAAAYASGFITSWDAIRIAYYRGFYAKRAAGPAGEKGAMLAVGTSFEDANDLCQIDEFKSKIWVAAHNSPTSVTLSGDIDFITKAAGVFEEEEKFARILKVDTAYHSAHMLKCSSSYLEALMNCDIKVQQPGENAPQWFSSVRGGQIVNFTESLNGQYWVENMVQPVLFCPAIETCLKYYIDNAINCGIEIGPHPALQGPVRDSAVATIDQEIPYTGTLNRGKSSTEALFDALGFLWGRFGPAAVSLGAFQQANCPSTPTKMIQGLPSYPWTHDRGYVVESRLVKAFHKHPVPFHDLLGVQTADGASEEWRWRNVLKQSELKWLSGHSLQGQVVFPATAYICLAMEAAIQLAQGRPIKSIDLFDLEIRKAIALHDSTGTELLTSLTKVTTVDSESKQITADFAAYSTISKDATNLALNCCGRVRVRLGDSEDSAFFFSPRVAPMGQLTAVDVDNFYKVLSEDFGFGYEGPFRALTNLSRKSGFATGKIICEKFDDSETTLLFHPAMLDSALQGLNAAHSAPGDGRLWTIVAPTFCRRISIIPELCGSNMPDTVDIDCIITDPRDTHVTGDVELFSPSFKEKIIEVEGLVFSPFAGAIEENDRHLFQESFLCLDKADADVVYGDRQPTLSESQKALDAERAAFYYLKTFHQSVSPEQRETLPWYRQALLKNAERLFNIVQDGKHPFALQSWITDTKEEVFGMIDSYPTTDADFNLTKAVGEHMLLPDVLNGDTSILQYMTKDNFLDDYYVNASGFQLLNYLIAGVMEQLCLKSPRMKFLEVGAGTGGATKAILEKIGCYYSSYTYTDISSAFFEHAAENFESHASKMMFKTLDITKDPAGQGFTPHSYDVIIASNVLHATESLKTTLEHTRKLLRPGGYLVMVEIIRCDVMRHGLVMGGLPGWWIGENDGRYGGPSLTLDEWDRILRETGFGGIETNSPMRDPVGVPGSIIVSRAQNEIVSQLSSPLDCKSTNETQSVPLLVLGSRNPIISRYRDQICSALAPHFTDIVQVDQLEDLPVLPEAYHVLSLIECEANLFEAMNEPVFSSLKTVLGSALSVLWLLRDRRSNNPNAGTTLGLFRTLFYELPGTLLQTLDIESVDMNDCAIIAAKMCQIELQSHIARRAETNEILWEFEPEIVLKDGQILVPRVRQHGDQNNRYNSSKRSITKKVDVGLVPLTLDWVDNSYMLREQHAVQRDSVELVTIIISCSLLSSIKTPVGYVFVGLGEDANTGQKTVCFSRRNESIVTVPKSWTVTVDEVEIDGQFMSFLIADLIVQWVLRMLPPTGSVLACEPDAVVASLLAQQLQNLGRKGLFITSNPEMSTQNWVYVHSNSSERAITGLLPADVTLYVDASGAEESHSQGLGSKIAEALSPICDKVKMSSLIASEASILPYDAPESITDLLLRVTSFASSLLSAQATPEGAPLDILPLKRVIAKFVSPDPMSLVYWREDQYVPVSIQPVQQRSDLFRPDRTYWLAGLAGDTGRSLADFMVAHNARNIVLTSRSPPIDRDWLQLHSSRGATIKYLAGDITSFESMKEIYDTIRESMPPIGGVANGAMVLRDSSFMNMDFNDFQAVLGPKVQGSTNLDRLFCNPEEPLDWFIGFSSIAATTGNPGQSAYTAGNCFIKALVDRRRKRGLAGSVIDITRLVGLGFIERESRSRLTREHKARLTTRSGTIAMCENDLHHLFAEAILSGRPSLGRNPEIITGLAPLLVEQAKHAHWKTNARMSLLIREMGQGDARVGEKGNAVPLRQLLKTANTIHDVTKVLSGALKGKLKALKFLSDSDSLYNATPLVDMGVDSLVAVEVRSWFLKELGVDIPVMKILGGASIADLVDAVVQELPQELSGLVDSQGDSMNSIADQDSDEGKASGADSASDNGLGGSHSASGTNDTDTDSVTSVNFAKGAVVIDEIFKLENKVAVDAGPVIINSQEVA